MSGLPPSIPEKKHPEKDNCIWEVYRFQDETRFYSSCNLSPNMKNELINVFMDGLDGNPCPGCGKIVAFYEKSAKISEAFAEMKEIVNGTYDGIDAVEWVRQARGHWDKTFYVRDTRTNERIDKYQEMTFMIDQDGKLYIVKDGRYIPAPSYLRAEI